MRITPILAALMLTACSGGALTRSAGLAPVRPGANIFLWRAALETARAMPLRQAERESGVIITGWHELAQPSGAARQRFALVIYILDNDLSASGLAVRLFRQSFAEGGWRDQPVAQASARLIEDLILARAQELRSGLAISG